MESQRFSRGQTGSPDEVAHHTRIEENHRVSVRQRDANIEGRVHIAVRCMNRGEPPALVFRFDIQFVATYQRSGDLAEVSNAAAVPKAILQQFGEYNVIYNVWPYFRSCLHRASLDMGLSPVVAPVLKRL